MKYLLGKGYTIHPVNPGVAGQKILGQHVYASLADVPAPVDVIDIFRASDAALEVTREAIALKDKLGLKVLWMQLGVRNDEAAREAEAAGLKVIMNRCPKIEYGRLSGEIGWAGVNTGTISSVRPKLRRARRAEPQPRQALNASSFHLPAEHLQRAVKARLAEPYVLALARQIAVEAAEAALAATALLEHAHARQSRRRGEHAASKSSASTSPPPFVFAAMRLLKCHSLHCILGLSRGPISRFCASLVAAAHPFLAQPELADAGSSAQAEDDIYGAARMSRYSRAKPRGLTGGGSAGAKRPPSKSKFRQPFGARVRCLSVPRVRSHRQRAVGPSPAASSRRASSSGPRAAALST